MKKQDGYFRGVVMLMVYLILYAIPFSIVSVGLSFFVTPMIKNVGVLEIVISFINLLAALCIAYFGVKSFVKNRETPNNKKMIISTFLVLFVLELLSIFTGKEFSASVILGQIVQMVLVYFIVLYSVKKNSI